MTNASLNFAESMDRYGTWVAVVRRPPHVHDKLEGAGAEAVDALADVGAGVGRGVHPPDLEVTAGAPKDGVAGPAVGVDPLVSLKHNIFRMIFELNYRGCVKTAFLLYLAVFANFTQPCTDSFQQCFNISF